MLKNLLITSLMVILFSLTQTTPIYAQTVISNTKCTQVGNPTSENPCASLNNNFVYYCQADPLWQTNQCSINLAGCGPTSMAMIASSLGIVMTPLDMDQIFRQVGARGCGEDFGSSLGSLFGSSWFKERFEMQPVALTRQGYLDLNDAQNWVDKGYIILGSSAGKTFPCMPGGFCRVGGFVDHIFVVDGTDVSNNKMSARDPMNCRPENPQEVQANIMKENNFALQGGYAIKRK